MRTPILVIVLVAVVTAALVASWPYLVSSVLPEQAPSSQGSAELDDSTAAAVVPTNRSPEVQDGFSGDVHPLLQGTTNLEVTARWHWTPPDAPPPNRRKVAAEMPPRLRKLCSELTVARASQDYGARDFSGFMPKQVEAVGQLWTLDEGKIIAFLKQFHPKASLHLLPKGTRAGPDGAFAILRALSPAYLDIVFRIHAEFDVTPEKLDRRLPVAVWYTPASFFGRMIVNRAKGNVVYFQLGIPAGRTLNVHLTVFVAPQGDHHDIIRVEQMELIGGDKKLPEQIRWTEALELAQAQDRLAHQFYKFKEINWVPLEQALAIARDRKKPILAVVTWGALDDQSC